MLDKANLNFQRLREADMPLLHQWLNTDFVKEWYQDEPTDLAGVTEQYRPLFDGSDPTQAFIIRYADTPIGYIQTYLIDDKPAWLEPLPPTEVAGVDLYIGHPEYIHQGLGSDLLKKFMREFVFSQPQIKTCIIDPEPANKAAIQAYQKAGFIYWKTIHDPIPDDAAEEHYIMRLARTAFEANLAT